MPQKFKSCVRKVSASMKKTGYQGNPYAICRVSTKFYGSTRHKK